MGPDLARIGGKYPDAWHVQHLEDPTAMVPASNMPAYAFLRGAKIDPAYTRRKMDTLGFAYAAADIASLQGKSEMDAMVAYLQKLGSDVGWRKVEVPAAPADLKNPHAANPAIVLAEGAALYAAHCAQCHKPDLTGDVGPELTGLEGRAAGELFQAIHGGVPDGGMPSYSSLGADRVWKLVTFLQHRTKP
jgi:cytochrome c oxidase cbb3-type subunit 2